MRESSTSWKAKEEKSEGWSTGLLLDLERQLESDPTSSHLDLDNHGCRQISNFSSGKGGQCCTVVRLFMVLFLSQRGQGQTSSSGSGKINALQH